MQYLMNQVLNNIPKQIRFVIKFTKTPSGLRPSPPSLGSCLLRRPVAQLHGHILYPGGEENNANLNNGSTGSPQVLQQIFLISFINLSILLNSS